MHCSIIIPARLKSTRFPAKPLAMINGRALILRVVDIASKLIGKDCVFVATDADEIDRLVKDNGFQSIMTSPDNLTGTDRVAEAAKYVNSDIIINIQGDEPMIEIADIQRVIDAKMAKPNMVANAYCRLNKGQDPVDVNIPKVVVNEVNKLLYMSRAAVPGTKSGLAEVYFRQVCIYGFNHQELNEFARFGRKSDLEVQEDIEILRFFELGRDINMVEVAGGSLAVDVPEDVAKVEAALNTQKNETHQRV